MNEKNLTKDIFWNIIGTTINAFVSLFLLIIVTRINGQEIAGIFTFAFSVSLIFSVIGTYYGRNYQISDKKNNSDYDYIISKIILCIIVIFISFIFVILNNYNLYKSVVIMVLCSFKCIEAFMESIYAILQKNKELYKVGISLAFKGLIGVIVFFIVDLSTKNIIHSSLSIIVIHILFIIFYDYNSYKRIKVDKRINKNNIIFLLKDGFYPFVIAFLSSYIINASKYAIDINLDEVSQTIFGIIVMPATVLPMFVSYLVTPYVLDISNYYFNNNYNLLKKLIKKFNISIVLVGLLGVFVAYTIAIPILNIIYGINLSEYKIHLVIIMLGATLYGIFNMLSNILIIMRKNKLQSIILLFVSIITFVMSYLLTKHYNLFGSSISFLISLFILFIIYIIIIKSELKIRK